MSSPHPPPRAPGAFTAPTALGPRATTFIAVAVSPRRAPTAASSSGARLLRAVAPPPARRRSAGRRPSNRSPSPAPSHSHSHSHSPSPSSASASASAPPASPPQSQPQPQERRRIVTDVPAPPSATLFAASSFAGLGLAPELVAALEASGIATPTVVQARAIPAVLGGADVVVGAATGSGKTLSYLLPIVQQLKNAEAMHAPSSSSSSSSAPVTASSAASANAADDGGHDVLDDLGFAFGLAPSSLRTRRRPRAIVVVPTRELAEQVGAVARDLSHRAKFRAVTLVGGTGGAGLRRVRERLDAGGVDVLVATTGRLLQLVDARELDIRFTSHLVIDEVDTMLDEGFGPDVRRLIRLAGSKLGNAADGKARGSEQGQREQDEQYDDDEDDDENEQGAGYDSASRSKVQLIAVGATHPPDARALYDELMPRARPVAVDLHRAPAGLEQRFVRVASNAKVAELLALLRGLDDDERRGGPGARSAWASSARVMVFVNSVDAARFVHHTLRENGIRAACVHGAMPAATREREFARFSGNAQDNNSSAPQQQQQQQGAAVDEVRVLVATDVAGRGVDDVRVGHVILFDFPRSAVDYVHRAGRTARAGARGRVTSLVTRADETLARAMERAGRARVDALDCARDGWLELRQRRLDAKRAAAAAAAAAEEDSEDAEDPTGMAAQSVGETVGRPRSSRAGGAGGGRGYASGGRRRAGGGRGGGGAGRGRSSRGRRR